MNILLGQFCFSLFAGLIGVVTLRLLSTAPDRLRLWVCLVSIFIGLIPLPMLFGISDLSWDEQPVIVGVAFEQLQGVVLNHETDLLWLLPIGIFSVSFCLIGAAWMASFSQVQELVNNSLPWPVYSKLAEPELQSFADGVAFFKVTNSAIVATSGYLRPAVWIGDQLLDEHHLECAVNHELQHIKHKDNYLLFFIVFIERFLWWNPAVWFLGARARDAMEHHCDKAAAGVLGESVYRVALAEMMLLKQKSPPPLRLNMLQAHKQIQRLEKLVTTTKTTTSHRITICLGIIALMASAASTAELPTKILTLDGCHTLLPSGGDYELKITSTRNVASGNMSVSFVDHDDDWETMPDAVLPFLECVRLVVGVGTNEGWPTDG